MMLRWFVFTFWVAALIGTGAFTLHALGPLTLSGIEVAEGVVKAPEVSQLNRMWPQKAFRELSAHSLDSSGETLREQLGFVGRVRNHFKTTHQLDVSSPEFISASQSKRLKKLLSKEEYEQFKALQFYQTAVQNLIRAFPELSVDAVGASQVGKFRLRLMSSSDWRAIMNQTQELHQTYIKRKWFKAHSRREDVLRKLQKLGVAHGVSLDARVQNVLSQTPGALQTYDREVFQLNHRLTRAYVKLGERTGWWWKLPFVEGPNTLKREIDSLNSRLASILEDVQEHQAKLQAEDVTTAAKVSKKVEPKPEKKPEPEPESEAFVPVPSTANVATSTEPEAFVPVPSTANVATSTEPKRKRKPKPKRKAKPKRKSELTLERPDETMITIEPEPPSPSRLTSTGTSPFPSPRSASLSEDSASTQTTPAPSPRPSLSPSPSPSASSASESSARAPVPRLNLMRAHRLRQKDLRRMDERAKELGLDTQRNSSRAWRLLLNDRFRVGQIAEGYFYYDTQANGSVRVYLGKNKKIVPLKEGERTEFHILSKLRDLKVKPEKRKKLAARFHEEIQFLEQPYIGNLKIEQASSGGAVTLYASTEHTRDIRVILERTSNNFRVTIQKKKKPRSRKTKWVRLDKIDLSTSEPVILEDLLESLDGSVVLKRSPKANIVASELIRKMANQRSYQYRSSEGFKRAWDYLFGE